LQKTMKNQAFHEVSLRLLLRKIHLPLGKGGFAQLELICKSSLQTRIRKNHNHPKWVAMIGNRNRQN
ncbi:MAG: hypothetical protein J6A67_00935, partial [Clostridia bacterium]|nr:hypothetical protein [Clostridia bacterium]